ncbi:putative Histidine kinase DNA gyrase B and HSP90 like ATPase Hsp90 protein [Trypanosoma vivax]|uniref:Putative heat shock protein n=1 Tax=Trypanosoma vivax (strain Y486) TaxID=1055687 RepID=G0UAF3_TRYVY|nr:heat shock protein precursor [Trypanosoma vivax]KAH8618009.1 putative Histidine kinase DNA gyrase B and HSP90 like ATPase Hsp90 protein [Trypanosoma vivax]CCC52786.1 putative heat shock protein [Trypanosoma vivax Y486]
MMRRFCQRITHEGIRVSASFQLRVAGVSAAFGGSWSTGCLASDHRSSNAALSTAVRFCSTTAEGAGAKPSDVADDDIVIDPVAGSNGDAAAGEGSPAGAKAAEDSERVVGNAEEMGFKTETRQLLDIVACSLYTEKEVFIRELVSNASDALEKRHLLEISKPDEYPRETDDEAPIIAISCNQSKSRFVIRDTGVGMTKEELAENLGTIAGSGSKAFVRELQSCGNNSGAAEKIIGQFGVGFYAAFMVSRNVKVYSRSAKKGSKGYVWESDGTGTFTIAECEGVEKGTKIVLDVKDTELSFCTPQVCERVLKRYSNFVSYEITLNGGKVNTVEALWMKDKNSISNEEHIDFYKFISGAYDSPMFRLHYSVDAPLSIRALLYVPQSHTEKYGGGRMESGVNLYCRRVLIQSKAKGLLPEWLRFIKGAVDTESIPLNVSREHTQDGSMMRRLSTVLTKRIIRWFETEAKEDKQKYERFIKEYGPFLKEGVCTDQVHKMELAKLLRFETTKTDVDYPFVSLDEYRDRMLANQTHIYYINAPTREMALESPYYEQYKEHDLEVLICTEPVDDFVMQHLDTYAKHKLQNIEMYDATLDGSVQHKLKLEGDKGEVKVEKQLTEAQVKSLSDFISKRLVGRVGVVKSTTRLRDSPAVIADHESAQMRKIYRITGQMAGAPPKYNLHFNPKHPVVRKLYTLSISPSAEEVETAGLLAEQMFDNAVISAGLLEDPRSIVSRLNNIMMRMVESVPEPTADK